jgi:hypothetical protein
MEGDWIKSRVNVIRLAHLLAHFCHDGRFVRRNDIYRVPLFPNFMINLFRDRIKVEEIINTEKARTRPLIQRTFIPKAANLY